MSSSNRTTSRGGKGPKGDKAHKVDKSDSGKGSGDKQQLSGGGGGDSTNKSEELKIKQIMEMTQRPEPQVCLALHECDYDMDRAVDMLLDIKDPEWETTVKKKKNRQTSTSKSEQKADGGAQGGTGDDWNDTPVHQGGDGEKDKGRNKTGGPQRLHGRHNDSRGWRGREKQENERNLEDGGPNRDRRGRSSGSTRGGGGGRGRGGGRAGGRYPRGSSRGGTFNNSRPMETWDNSNTWDGGNTNHSNTDECWDEFPGADEWCGTETKVFTPSQPPEPVIEPEPTPDVSYLAAPTPIDNSSPSLSNCMQQMDMLVQMQQQQAQNSPVQMGGALNAAQTQYFSQLTQQNTNNDVNKYSGQAQQPPGQQSTYSSTQQYTASQPPSTYNNSGYTGGYSSTVQDSVPVQQAPVRTKTQRARVPPPSKIPASAVEMPGDLNSSIGYLDLQFGAMDIMSDSSSFDGVSDPKHQNTSPLDNSTSSATMDLNTQQQNSTTIDTYSSPPKPNAQSSISSALSQSLSNSDSIPQTSEHIATGYNTATVTTQRSTGSGVSSNTQTSSNTSGLEQLNKQSDTHSYSQASTYSSYPSKSTSYQNQTYSSSSNYSGTQTTSSYVSNQATNSYVNSDTTSYNSQSASNTYQNAYSGNSSYQSNTTSGSFPSISQANSYPSNNQAYQQNASQSVYGANTGLNNSSTNYSSNSAAQYNSYNSNHKLVKETSSGYESSTTATSSVSSTSTSTTSGLALTQTTASATKANTALVKNSSNVVSNMPPSPAVMSTQYIMGQVPYFQPQMYSYEDMQMLQQRIPHMTTPFYEMSYQTPTTTLRDGSYSLTDGRFTRTDSNASPVPSTQTSTQPMLAAQTTGPYFFTPYNPMQPSYQFGTVYTSQLPAGTNAHGSSNSAQYPKPTTYGSGYTSGYDTLNQSQDYNKGGYVGNTQSQNKGTGANASSTGNAANDLSAMYGKSHAALGKVNSYDKQGFHSGTPPPFTATLGQNTLAPGGTGYGPQMYIPTIPHQQHHSTPLMHQPMHQDSGNSTGQRTQANNQPKTGAKQGYPNSYWNQS